MKLVLILSLLFSGLAIAQDSSSVKEGNITLDCDTNVDGAVCPSKYATKAGLFDDTTVRDGSSGSTTKGTK